MFTLVDFDFGVEFFFIEEGTLNDSKLENLVICCEVSIKTIVIFIPH